MTNRIGNPENYFVYVITMMLIIVIIPFTLHITSQLDELRVRGSRHENDIWLKQPETINFSSTSSCTSPLPSGSFQSSN